MALNYLLDPSDLPLNELSQLLSFDSKIFKNIKIQKRILQILDLIIKMSHLCEHSHPTNIALRKTCIEVIGSLNLMEIFGNIPEISTDRLTALLYGLTGLAPNLKPYGPHLTYEEAVSSNDGNSTLRNLVGDR